ncbi:MAG: U32 family peptidase, partial [Candidatus Omnitrophica bacterium]|nr:U32 family peptidase [Candidatus Omnitrophota bacterium]
SLIHKNKSRGYLALNVIIYDKEIDKVRRILAAAKKAKVDAVILWDMAVFSLASELGLKVHISTQASVCNYLALSRYVSLGAARIVLAREARLAHIKSIITKIKKDKLNCQIEAFIHGAMCISVSGRCFLSEYTFSKSANRGECWQPCRREYKITDDQAECEYVLGQDYILSPKDLCTIDFIDKLIECGIDAFKIEGRIRSAEYVKVVTSCYRRAIDAYFAKRLTARLKSSLQKELFSVYTRGFSSGFYFGQPKDARSRRLEHEYEKVYVGDIARYFKKIKVAEILVRDHGLKKGDKILCLGKNTPASFAAVDEIQINHEFVEELKKGQSGGIKVPFELKRRDKVFLWRKKS